MKAGIFKGIKYISQIFVYNDREVREMNIGYPTDVKHVTHIGLDPSSLNNPSWMTEFKTAPEFSSSSWASDDFQPPVELLQQGGAEIQLAGSENSPKTTRRKKSKSASNPKSSSKPPKQRSHSSDN